MPQHIGIVAVSPEGTSFCYRVIGRRASEVADPSRRPRVTLHNLPFSSYVEAIGRGDWEAVAAMLSESARVLFHAGADFCILPDNVCHHALPMAQVDSPIPWVNMIELVADAAGTAGCKQVGLIGTKFVTFGSTYQTLLGLRGIHLMVPDEDEAEMIDRVIFREAVFGRVMMDSRKRINATIARLGERGCDAVILGSSEASLLTTADEAPLPMIDPMELLAAAAVERAIAGT